MGNGASAPAPVASASAAASTPKPTPYNNFTPDDEVAPQQPLQVPTEVPKLHRPREKAAKVTITVMRTVVEKIGPALPFPGSTVAKLLVELLKVVETAMLNKENLELLSADACDYLEIINVNYQDLRQRQCYNRVVCDFQDLLQEIKEYATVFTQKQWITKVISANFTQQSCQMFSQRLRELCQKAHFVMISDTHAELKRLIDRLNAPKDYQERFAEAQRIIELKGGLQEVQKSKSAMEEVVKACTLKEQINDLVMQHALAVWDAARVELGFHTYIKNVELSVLWQKCFNPQFAVPWKVWWDKFPAAMKQLGQTKEYVADLQQLVATDAAKGIFQDALEDKDPDTISVMEVQAHFGEDADVVEVVRRIVAADSNLIGGGGRWYGACNIPPQELLYGRDDEVQELTKALQQPGCQALQLLGPGGIGKTSLAVAVARSLWEVGWIPGGATMVDLGMQGASREKVLARLCAACQVEKADDLGGLLEVLQCAPGRYLLLVDNAEDAAIAVDQTGKPYLPWLLGQVLAASQNIYVLITSRSRVDFPAATSFEVRQLSTDAARSLVAAVVPNLSAADLSDVVAVCDRMPLTLRLLANTLLGQHSNMQDIRELEFTADSSIEDPALSLALRSLEAKHRLVMAQLSVFPSTFDIDGADAVLRAAATRATLTVLYSRNLLQLGQLPSSYILHPNVRAQAASLSPKDVPLAQQRFVEYVVADLKRWGELWDPQPQDALRGARRHLPDLAAVMAIAADPAALPGIWQPLVQGGLPLRLMDALGMLQMPEFESMWRNLAVQVPAGSGAEHVRFWLAECLNTQGRYREAEPLQRRALENDTEAMGPDHAITLASLNNLANCLQAQSRYDEAEPLYRRVLKTKTETLGPDHKATLFSVHNLAICLEAQGRHGEAESLYRRAMEGKIAALGQDHPDTLMTVTSLANCLEAEGHHDEAEPLYRRAMEGGAKALGPDHPETLLPVYNLAVCLQRQGRHAEAEPLYRRAMEGRTEALGPDHADTLAAIDGLANCLCDQGRNDDAEPLYRRAMEARTEDLGPKHPDVLRAVYNLALCLQAQRRYGEAEPLYRRAMEGRTEALGPGHSDTLAAIDSLANCLCHLGRNDEAEPLYRRAMKGSTATLGPGHRDTLACVYNLAICLQAQKRHGEAEPLYRRAMEGRTEALGPDHADTLAAIDGLANCLCHLGRNEEAEPLYRGAMQGRTAALGPGHLDTLVLVYNLAVCLEAQKRHSEAEPLYQRAVQGRTKALGPAHTDTLAAVSGLARCLGDQGRNDEAEPLYRQAMEGGTEEGSDFLNSLASLNNLANCLQDQSRYGEAEPLYRQALEKSTKALGPNNPDTISSVHNLAICLHAQGRHGEAEPFYRRVMEGRTEALGPGDPDTIKSVNDLANCLYNQDRNEEAEPLYRHALKGRTAALGPGHHDTLALIYNLASCLQAQRRHSEAEPLYRRVMEGRTEALGPGHLDTLAAVSDLADCLSDQGHNDEAEPLYRRAIIGRTGVLGPSHSDTLALIYNLASCLQAQRRHGEAEPLYRRAMEGRTEALGPGHRDTLAAVNGLANCLNNQGRNDEAEPLYRRAVKGRTETLGPDHPDTLASVYNMAGSLQSQGRHSKAEPLWQRAVEGYTKVHGADHKWTRDAAKALAVCRAALRR